MSGVYSVIAIKYKLLYFYEICSSLIFYLYVYIHDGLNSKDMHKFKL